MRATEDLVQEHQGIKRMLAILERMAERLTASQPVAINDLRESLDFIQGFADRCHHAKEEDLLFPAMEAAGMPHRTGPIAVMLHEHGQGRTFVQGMVAAVPRYAADDRAAARTLAESIRGYTTLLAAHIDKEDHVLYPMADQKLSPDIDAELVEGFERIEHDIIGPGKHEEYHRLLDRLSNTYLGA